MEQKSSEVSSCYCLMLSQSLPKDYVLIAVSFTCVLPVWFMWDTIGNTISKVGGNINVQWVFSIAFGAYIYFRYNFLTNITPLFALPAYDTGIHSQR
jgi:hypothetical protein